MYRKAICLMLSIVMLIMLGCATGRSVVSPELQQINPDRVAIVEISGDIRGGTPKNQVEDFLAMEFLDKGYRIIERSRVDSILEEQDFARSEVTTQQEAARIGEILNVPAVAMIDISLTRDKVSITSRMVATETGEVLWIGTGRSGAGTLPATLGGGILGAIVGNYLGDGTLETVAGGVLGGVAGYELSPQEARVVQRAIENMAEELPRRGM